MVAHSPGANQKHAVQAFRSMYDLAGMAATALGVAHPAQRFFFRHVGHVFMLTHSDPEAESGIRHLPEASADEVLAESPVVGRGEGFRPRAIARELLRSVLDHTHTSYGHDLLVAAKLALHRHGVGGVAGSSPGRCPQPPDDTMHGSSVPHSLAWDTLKRRSNTSARGQGHAMHDPSSVGSEAVEASDIVQLPRRRSLTTHARSGGAGQNRSTSPSPVDKSGDADAGTDAVGAGGKRGPAGVLALARGRIAGVRIKNGVVWRPDNATQAPIGSVSKPVLGHRRQDDILLVEVADRAACKENASRGNGDILPDVVPLPSSPGKAGMRTLDGGAKGNVL